MYLSRILKTSPMVEEIGGSLKLVGLKTGWHCIIDTADTAVVTLLIRFKLNPKIVVIKFVFHYN